jgi:2'-5' RNA ligase
VAVWPPPGFLDGLPRPETAAVRWTPTANLHVTLRFLGPASIAETAARLDGLAASPTEASVGPATERLGRGVLMLPVAGLDAVAGAVESVLGPDPDGRPFRGHITVARGRGRGRRGVVPSSVAGAPFSGSFPVEEVTLVRSAGGRYSVVGRWVLGTNRRSE